MTTNRLERALERYEEKLATLEEAAPNSTPPQFINVLTARDAVHRALSDKTQDPADRLLHVIKLDARLKKQAGAIPKGVKLAGWRKSLGPPDEAWWWALESLAPPHKFDRLDWLWGALTVALLTIALSLAVDISRRFLSGGSDFYSALAVISQAVASLLVARGALTKAGREAGNRWLKRFPAFIREEIRLVAAAVLLLAIGGLWQAMPAIAVRYNNAGALASRAGDLTHAQYDFQRALSLHPDYPEAHYNLGLLHEDLFDFQAAQREYIVAVQGGLDAAYNNLARLYILEGAYSQAAALLLDGLKLAADDEVAYDMRKNLGWARLEQARFDEAAVILAEALTLQPDRAPAHCLLVQVLEGQGNPEGALTEWEKCLQYAEGTNPDEDAWIGGTPNRYDGQFKGLKRPAFAFR